MVLSVKSVFGLPLYRRLADFVAWFLAERNKGETGRCHGVCAASPENSSPAFPDAQDVRARNVPTRCLLKIFTKKSRNIVAIGRDAEREGLGARAHRGLLSDREKACICRPSAGSRQ
jgi:hypothetical protein